MRYQKGSISLNEQKDKGILTRVADSRYITHSQLFELLWADLVESNRKVYNWRIRRLVTRGLLRKQVVPYLNGEALYSISRAGIQALERLGVYYLGANLDHEKDPNEFQIPHALELNNIRLALARTCSLVHWVPESFIRVRNLSPVSTYAKIYDGIATVLLQGSMVDFAIEYERTLKSQAKYDKIYEAIESEKRLKTFLYLVPSYDLQYDLVHEFQTTRKWMLFGLIDQFKREVFNTKVYTPALRREVVLEHALLAMIDDGRK
jgi:hypothetical protein